MPPPPPLLRFSPVGGLYVVSQLLGYTGPPSVLQGPSTLVLQVTFIFFSRDGSHLCAFCGPTVFVFFFVLLKIYRKTY